MKNNGFLPTNILIPKVTNMNKWSCVACDQYTSEPEYWKDVEDYIGDDISTLSLMLPEIYLNEIEERAAKITENMKKYVQTGVFKELKNCFIYVERTLLNGKIRKGLVGAIDLEVYDFSKNTISLCRPTEATVVERLPARVEVRKKAVIEMPHIMMLIDDKNFNVIQPYENIKSELDVIYDFELMKNSGHIKGYKVDSDYANIALDGIEMLIKNSKDKNPMIYAMGDGNHSLAAAKQYYEYMKNKLGADAENHPSRYALVELVNLHDNALEFEPIHRIVFNVNTEKFISELKNYCGFTQNQKDGQNFNMIIDGSQLKCTFTNPNTSLTIGTLQNFIDDYISRNGGETDYIHGDDVVLKLSKNKNTIGFTVNGIDKNSFFDVIKKDGILPRKTFSMGNACDKRFYLECRIINN